MHPFPLRIRRSLAAPAAAAGLGLALMSAAPAHAITPDFTLFDDTAYTSATIGHGAVSANIVPNSTCTPLVTGGAMPTQAQWRSIVEADDVNTSAPLVLDCESLYLTGSATTAAANLADLEQLQAWAIAVAPGQTIGWYGMIGNTDSAYYSDYQQLLSQDPNPAFFPSAYTFSTDESTWVSTLSSDLTEATAIDPSVPVYPYVWPQYHEAATPASIALTFIPANQFSFELATIHDLGLTGAVIWGGSNPSTCDSTCESEAGSEDWLPATQSYLDWVTSGADQATDLARSGTATASSTYSSSYPAQDAIDGDATTRWISAYSDPQWIQVDLGAVHSITGARLVWNGYATAFSIQSSTDGVNWTTLYSTTSGTGGAELITGLSGSGRYVRMYGTARGTTYGYALWSFNIYGS
jgi:hypothetical protein